MTKGKDQNWAKKTKLALNVIFSLENSQKKFPNTTIPLIWKEKVYKYKDYDISQRKG